MYSVGSETPAKDNASFGLGLIEIEEHNPIDPAF